MQIDLELNSALGNQTYFHEKCGSCTQKKFYLSSISQYIFPWGKFAEFTFFGVADSKFLSGIIFFQGTELSKIKFQGIYKSNNHSFKGVLVFKNLVFHTPV